MADSPKKLVALHGFHLRSENRVLGERIENASEPAQTNARRAYRERIEEEPWGMRRKCVANALAMTRR